MPASATFAFWRMAMTSAHLNGNWTDLSDAADLVAAEARREIRI